MKPESKAMVRELLDAFEEWRYQTTDADRDRFIKAQKALVTYIEGLEKQVAVCDAME